MKRASIYHYQWNEQNVYQTSTQTSGRRNPLVTVFNAYYKNLLYCWRPEGVVILSTFFLQITRTLRVFLNVPRLTVMSVFASQRSVFLLFLSLHFILCQPSSAYHITNPFYNSLHFSGSLQTTGLPEIGSLCVSVLEDGLAPVLRGYHSQGPRPIAVRTCGQTWRGNMQMFDESGQIFPPGKWWRRRGGINECSVCAKLA